jgi:hypothetical protein|tara:strand:+ start:956 stop:1219 length:264 start_codon:yes stop_codon:yes gene_type:complete
MKTLKRIHINQHIIKSNIKNNKNLPPITVRTSKKTYKAHHVTINGNSKVIYSPEKPLSCGAKVWIETNGDVNTNTYTREGLHGVFNL